MKHIHIFRKSCYNILVLLSCFGSSFLNHAQNSELQQRLRVYYVEDPNTASRALPVTLSADGDIFGGNPNMETAQQLTQAIFYGDNSDLREQLTTALQRIGGATAVIFYDDTQELRDDISDTWTNCVRNDHFFACATREQETGYRRIVHYGAHQMNREGLERAQTSFLRLLSGSSSTTGWWDEVRTPTSIDSFNVCIPYVTDYEVFRRSVVTNSSEIRRGMVHRSNPEHAERVIDRRADLRDIHRGYSDAGITDGQRVCLSGYMMRDERRWVALIRFATRDIMDFSDEGSSVSVDQRQAREREIRTLRQNFDNLVEETLPNIRTFFGRPDSHDLTMSSVISVYCNNLIRLSRGERTMIPAEVSRSFATPYVQRAERDWQRLTNNDSSPALRGHGDMVRQHCRDWARRVLREHGNTTDRETIENFLNQGMNGYRNY